MITTQRTILRPIEPADAEQVLAYRSDAETNQYQGWIPKSLAEVNEYIAKKPDQINQPETWFQLIIVEKESQTVIGDIGLHFIDTDNFQVEVGCTLSKTQHGKGFATEALKAAIDYVFRELNKHRITASIDPGNTASIQLFERLGFRKEGHFKESLWIDGKWVDDIIYAILQREWMAKAG